MLFSYYKTIIKLQHHKANIDKYCKLPLLRVHLWPGFLEPGTRRVTDPFPVGPWPTQLVEFSFLLYSFSIPSLGAARAKMTPSSPNLAVCVQQELSSVFNKCVMIFFFNPQPVKLFIVCLGRKTKS